MMQRRYTLRNPEKRQKHVRIWVSGSDSDSASDSWCWSWSSETAKLERVKAVVLAVPMIKANETGRILLKGDNITLIEAISA
jgi:hypothetical protein